MCLYQKLTEDNFYSKSLYYKGQRKNSNPLKDIRDESCYRFIEKYFEAGSKQKVFDINFESVFKEKGKHIHTAILYFLGYYLKDIVEEKLYRVINLNDSDISWFDFRYTWFLSCLDHDTASVIEKEERLEGRDNRFKEIDYYLGKYNIHYNVYDYQSNKQDTELHTFSRNLVRNYFFYKADYRNSIDHGIMGGFLLFDRLIKNYNDTWKEKKEIL